MSFRMAEVEGLAKIKVIGIGGGGGNAVNTMVESNLQGVEFIAANTDIQALTNSRADIRLQLGPETTKGLGAGADPQLGRLAAEESVEEVRKILKGADMVFVTAGLGGGTGTGGAPVVAKISREMGALTVGVVTKPFFFEAKTRMRKAEEGWEALREHVDTIITIPNDRLLTLMQKGSKMMDMMKKADDVLLQAVKGITDLINLPGYINVDFADLRTVMRQVGPAIMGAGMAQGENRAIEAAKRAIDNPLLQDIGIEGAHGVLINISATADSLTMNEFSEASAFIQAKAHENANIVVGALFDDTLGEQLRVTVIATGISEKEEIISAPESVVALPSRKKTEADEEAIPAGQDKAARQMIRRPRPQLRRPATLPSILDEAELETPTYLRKAAD